MVLTFNELIEKTIDESVLIKRTARFIDGFYVTVLGFLCNEQLLAERQAEHRKEEKRGL